MGSNFTPLNVPHSPSVPPAPPRSPKRSFDKKTLTILSGIIVFVGVIAGFIAIQSGFFFKPRATGDGTSYYSKGTGQTMSYDGRYVTIQDSKGIAMKLVSYKANQPYWGPAWTAVGAPTVTNVSNGSKVEAPCGFFQSDLIPQSATVYQSPSYNGDRYGIPGDGVLLAAVNGTRTCMSIPTPTPKPPTATPRPSNTPTKTPPTSTPIPSPTPTRVPVCGSNCSSDAQCPVGLKCYNTSIGTFTTPTGKCVLAKCLVAGTVCSADKCTVIPPTPTPTPSNTPTPKPSNTPPPTATLACPKPNPVKNLRINCPICKQT